MSFSRLFRPGRIGNLEVRNRIIGSPMEKNYCTAEGRITQRYIDYLEARARGGVGMMYTEATYVDPRGRGREYQMGLYSDDLIPQLRRLVSAVQRHGARIGPELNYGGRVVQPEVSGLQPWAPSAVRYLGAGGAPPLPLDHESIAQIVESFAAAARRAVEAGCDFVGIHGAHGYLLSQFLSPYCNKREDQYGGDLHGRLRFPLEVIAAIRRTIGTDVPLVFRISGDEHQDGGLTLADVCEIAPHLQAAGIALIDVSAGMYETNWWIVQPMEMPQGVLAPLARAVRAHVQIPVSVSGRINDPNVAEHLLAAETSDFVTMGRALHADPEFPNKAREGRLDEISSCIGCNQGCNDMHSRGLPIMCMVNTTSGHEREYAIRPVQASKRVVVIGGGPAGLESARVLALRGYRVTIFERDEEPGGQILLNRFVPGREEFLGILPWLVGAVKRAGARLETGVTATVDIVLGERPDHIIVATGATAGIPPIPGILGSPVVNAYDVLRRPIGGIDRALVIGTGIRGVGIARLLAARNVNVVLTDPGKDLVQDIAQRSRRFHLAALASSPNITVHLGTTVEALGERTATFWNGTDKWELRDIDLVVPTRPILPVTELADQLYQRSDMPPIHLLGDCTQPRNALDAMQDAAAFAHRL